MSTTTMPSSCSYQQLDKLHLNTKKIVRSSSSVHQTSCGIPSISSAKHGYCDTMRQQLYLSTINRRGKANRTIRMDLNALNDLPPVPVPSAPSGSPFPSWSSWMLLTIIPMILPFFKSKWGPLILLKNKMNMVLHNVETMAEGIEEVARRVDKLADEMTEKLPEGKLKKAIQMIDVVAEETIKKADLVEELVDKVEEAEDKLEDMIEDAIKDKVLAKNTSSDKQEDMIEDAIKDKVLAKNTSSSSKIPEQKAKADGGDASISA